MRGRTLKVATDSASHVQVAQCLIMQDHHDAENVTGSGSVAGTGHSFETSHWLLVCHFLDEADEALVLIYVCACVWVLTLKPFSETSSKKTEENKNHS